MDANEAVRGKRIVVTGASRGLGRAFAQALGAGGASVVVNGRTESDVATTAALVRDTGAAVESVYGSVADYATCEALIDRCVTQFGGIDGLVNNAGIVRDRTLMKMTPEEFDDVIAVNLRGTWACSQLAANAMKDSGGAILNVVSNSALQGQVGQTNYAAAKAGVVGMTRTWTRELERYGIRVNAIWPFAFTDMTKGVYERVSAEESEGRDTPLTPGELGFGDPADIAKLVVALMSDAGRAINGQIFTFTGTRLALWTHPEEVAVRERPAWSTEELVHELEAGIGTEQQPLYDRRAVRLPSPP
jgi:3-oxoacyl-[acyl-carrier protein] reductase